MLPNAVPDILVGVRIGLGYAWRAIVGAEMIAAASGWAISFWTRKPYPAQIK